MFSESIYLWSLKICSGLYLHFIKTDKKKKISPFSTYFRFLFFFNQLCVTAEAPVYEGETPFLCMFLHTHSANS